MSNTVGTWKRYAFGIAGMATALSAAASATAETRGSIPDMTPVLRRYQAESASVAVIRRGRITALGAWGVELALDEPMDR